MLQLPEIVGSQSSCNGDFREVLWTRYHPKWWSLRCQHRATTPIAEADEQQIITLHPGYGGAVQGYKQPEGEGVVWLFPVKCLVCGSLVLEGRLGTEYHSDRGGTSCGTLYVLKSKEYRPPLKQVTDDAVLAFWKDVWHFTTQHLGDFNKTTVAIAVAATVYFDNDPLFYAFVVASYLLIAVYASGWVGQWHIARQYYKAVGKQIQHDYKSSFDIIAKYLQGIYILAVVVVLSLMVHAHREAKMNKLAGNDNKVEKTRPMNPPRVAPIPQPTPKSTPAPPPPLKKG